MQENCAVEGVAHVIPLLKDANSLSSAGDPDAIENPPRNLRQLPLGWFPSSNWLRNKYGREAQITIFSIDNDRSTVQGGLDPFKTSSSSSLPYLTAMSPNGEVFAVASLDGKVDIREAENGELCKTVLCRHAINGGAPHKTMWMYFLSKSTLIAEFECGELHKYDLDNVRPHGVVYSLRPVQSPSNTFSACSLDRSIILRLVKLESSGNRGADTAKGDDDYDVDHGAGALLSAHALDCTDRKNLLLTLPSLEIPDGFFLDSKSLAISRNNQYASVVLIEREGNPHDARRLVHFWSIKETKYLGFRDVRCPKWEAWVPANQFHNDRLFLLRRRRDDTTQLDNCDLIADVYHLDDVHLRQDNRPTDDCVFFVVHTSRVHASSSPLTFTYSIDPLELRSAGFLYPADMAHFEILPLCIHDIIRGLQVTSQEIPLDIVGTLHQTSVALARLANDIPRRVGDVARAACNVARAACEVARATAAIDVSRGGCDTARDTARVSARVANLAARIADSAAMSGVNASAESEASVAANLALSFASHADYFADAFSTLVAPRSWPAIRCSGIFRDKVFQLPHYLASPLLLRANLHLTHQSGGSRIVVGGHPHPHQEDKWVPISVLQFRNIDGTESHSGALYASDHESSQGNDHVENRTGANANLSKYNTSWCVSSAPTPSVPRLDCKRVQQQ